MTTRSVDRDELARFAALVEAFGASPERWPTDPRAGAEALLARSAEARRQRDAAAELDALLDRAVPAAAPADLVGRVLAAAPQRPPHAAGASWWTTFWKPALGLAIAALVGIALGSVVSPFDEMEFVGWDDVLIAESEL